METTFTPWLSLGGGLLIGLSAVLLMLLLGRVMGATGILSGALFAESREEFAWRAALIAGMVSAPLLVFATTGSMPDVAVPVSLPMLVAGGLIAGLGVHFGSGCTSGHGVCGMARLSPRSLVATLCFMASAFATVYVVRHLANA